MFYPLLFPTPLSQQICTAAVSPLRTTADNEISRYFLQYSEKVLVKSHHFHTEESVKTVS